MFDMEVVVRRIWKGLKQHIIVVPQPSADCRLQGLSLRDGNIVTAEIECPIGAVEGSTTVATVVSRT